MHGSERARGRIGCLTSQATGTDAFSLQIRAHRPIRGFPETHIGLHEEYRHANCVYHTSDDDERAGRTCLRSAPNRGQRSFLFLPDDNELRDEQNFTSIMTLKVVRLEKWISNATRHPAGGRHRRRYSRR